MLTWVDWDTAPLVQDVKPCVTAGDPFAIHEGSARDALANLEGVKYQRLLWLQTALGPLAGLEGNAAGNTTAAHELIGEQPALISLGISKHLKLSLEPLVWPRVT